MKEKISLIKTRSKGFTLVELLIVIALIAILSVAVLATINPIEQANKAKDSTMQNDAAEVLNAYERYYAAQASYPWIDAVAASWAIDGSVDQSGIFQFFEVLGNGTLRQGKHFNDLATDTFVPGGQYFQDGDPGRVGQGFGKCCQVLLLL